MRSLCLFVVTIVAFTLADPPPPAVMCIYTKDTTDIYLTSQVDPTVGVAFDEYVMKLGLCDGVDLSSGVPVVINPYVRYYCISRIDSITFSPMPALPANAPASAAAPRLATQRISHR
jgi:hypothetical protein